MAEITQTERLPFPLAKPNDETYVTDSSQIGFEGDPLNEGLAKKYGDYSNNSEYLDVTTDSEGHILEATRKDGTKQFTNDVDAPNIRLQNALIQVIDEDLTQAQHDIETMSGDVEQVQQDVEQASEDITQLQGDVVEKYGDYHEIKEWLNVVTDKDNNMLEGTKPDGTKVFFGPIQSPTIEQQQQEIDAMQDSLGWFEKQLSEEWAEITFDKNGNIIKGVKRDGTVFVAKLESPNLDNQIKQQVINLIGNVDKDLTLKTSVFLPEEIRTRQGDATIPDFSDITLTPVEINTQSDFNKVLGLESGGSVTIASSNVLITLNTDVILDSTNLSIPDDRTIVINGNGHKIVGANTEYSATAEGSLIKGTYTYVPYTGNYADFLPNHEYPVGSYIKGINNGTTIYLVCKTLHTSAEDFATELSTNSDKWKPFSPPGNNVFVAPNGDALKLAKSGFYTAASQVYYNTGTEQDPVWSIPSQTTAAFASLSVYHCRFELPVELQSLSIDESDDVFVNLTSDWMSVQTKVTKAEGGYLYFDYSADDGDGGRVGNNYIGINNDYHVGERYVSFFLINYQVLDNHSCLIKNGYLMFPNRYAKVYESTRAIFDLTSSRINLKIFDAELVAAQIVDTSTPPRNTACNIIVDNCKIHGCKWIGIYITRGCRGYITNCEIYDMDISSINSKASLNIDTYVLAIGNYIHDVGIRRTNAFGVKGMQTYYIARNLVVNFGYCALWGGQSGQNNPSQTYPHGRYIESRGIIEYNTVYQTPEYFNEAHHHVPMDGGALYFATFADELIIRHNIVYNYNGRFGNRGIYLDGGCHNYYVYSNILANIPNSYSIKAYLANDTIYYGLPYTLNNVNKYILNNYLENGLEMGCCTNYPNDQNNYDEFIANHSYEVGDCITGIDDGTTYYLICTTAHTSASDFSTERSTNGDKWNSSSPNSEYYRGEYPNFEANNSYVVGDIVKGVNNNTTVYLMCKVAHTSENDFATELSVNGDKWEDSPSYNGEIKSGWYGQAVPNNKGYLGHNIFNEKMQTTPNALNGIQAGHQEEQYIINTSSYQGAFSTTLDIVGWLNKL